MIASRPNYLLERVKERRKELRRELARVDRRIATLTGTPARCGGWKNQPAPRIAGSVPTDRQQNDNSAAIIGG